MEFHFNKNIALRATAGYYLFQNDLVDEKRFGTLNDNYWKDKINNGKFWDRRNKTTAYNWVAIAKGV